MLIKRLSYSSASALPGRRVLVTARPAAPPASRPWSLLQALERASLAYSRGITTWAMAGRPLP